MDKISVEKITPSDFAKFAVWEFAMPSMSPGGAEVTPVLTIPVANLSNRLVGTKVWLKNGLSLPAMLGNVDVQSERSTRHFLAVSVWLDGSWFHLARYHDPDCELRNGQVLAQHLRMSVEDVFPLQADIRALVVGAPSFLKISVPQEPRERLSSQELIALSLGD